MSIIELPYIRTFITLDELKEAWETLCKSKGCAHRKVKPYKLRHVHIDPKYINNEYHILECGAEDYYRINFITDFFTEPARLKARRFDQKLSPAEYWKQDSQDIVAKNPDATPKALRSILYNVSVEVMNFRLTVAIALYDMFQPKSIFDPCAGHGDRVIAAMSRNYVTSYEGCEPNTGSHHGILAAMEVLGKEQDLQVHCIGFEDFKFEEHKYYDLVFTSPPYFDTEIYCSENTQSIARHTTQDVWYKEFLLVMFLRCWDHVEVNGHMVISINNVWDRQTNKMRFYCTEKLVQDLTSMCENAEFLGVISFGDLGKRMEPMFVWKKKVTN